MLRESDCRIMDTFDLIDRINCADTWNDEDVDVVLRELWDRYGDERDYDNIEHLVFGCKLCAEEVFDIITRHIYEDVEVHFYCMINQNEYCIISINGDENSEYAVTDDVNQYESMVNIYSFGTMRECKQYIKELIDNA